MVKIKKIAIITLSITALFVSAAIWFSMLQEFIPILLFCFLAWYTYIFSHYLVSGEFVHSRNEEIEIDLPDEVKGELESFIGFSLFVASFPLGIVAVNISNFSLLFSSVLIFIYGYAVLHKGLTGEIL